MTKHHRWKGSTKSLVSHMDAEKEDRLKWEKTEIENTVERLLKLTKSIGNGNKEAKMRKKSEATQLIQDFHKQYESLYSLYEDLRGEVKKKLSARDDDDESSSSSSSSVSDSDTFYTPEELNLKNDEKVCNSTVGGSREFVTPDSEYTTILKDKLTSTSEVKKMSEFEEYENVAKDLNVGDEQEEVYTKQMVLKMRDLEGEVSRLKVENGSLVRKLRETEDQVELKEKAVSKMENEVSRLEHMFKESEISYLARIGELEGHRAILQTEKGELVEEQDRSKGSLLEQVESLKKEVVCVKTEKSVLEMKFNNQLEEKTGSSTVNIQGLELEIDSLNVKKGELEEQILKMNQEMYESVLEKQELNAKISELQTDLTKSENELLAQENEFHICQDEMSAQIAFLTDHNKNLEGKFQSLEDEKSGLEMELEALKNDKKRLEDDIEKKKQATLELEDMINTLKNEGKNAQIKFNDPKSSNQLIERKMEEMAEEFRKQFEDKYRILSRRIRVAEQIHVENKECYQRTAQENKFLKERVNKTELGLRLVKDISLHADDVLTMLDSVALRFEECTGNFLNRISKASCELKFSKDWAMRKNKALKNVKDDLDCLLAQLDEKESEILMFREKVWKSENKIRELEKMIKEKEEGMVGLEEEKREAIRQLCVWIDYHRSRSDYYKKMLSEVNSRSRRAT
ncbi:uncharacterized protein [Primulina huaijiensis]|uniref:uncharacterized protein n=1 Tax=Primulina huaijiensis TaxID=1492673 RepID=UPI003CC6EB78